MSSCILYSNLELTVILIDIPRSIELAQGAAESSRKLLSSQPLEKPFPSLEPKSTKAKSKLEPASLQELLLQKHLEIALAEVKAARGGEWCLPRVTEKKDCSSTSSDKKRKRTERLGPPEELQEPSGNQPCKHGYKELESAIDAQGFFYQSLDDREVSIVMGDKKEQVRIPPGSTILHGDICDSIDKFTACAPRFDLVVMDPPWPNRSARRKKDYNISYGGPRDSRATLLYSAIRQPQG